MLTAQSSLVDVSFAVCTTLAQVDVTAVLCGGSAATFYNADYYQSLDADFVLRLIPHHSIVASAMMRIGYKPAPNGMYAHPNTPYTVEFPRGPLAIGRDVISTWQTIERNDELLHVISITDCVRDRFMHFWAWNDRSALEVALAVANSNRDRFDRKAFHFWTENERAQDRSYPTDKVDEFFRRLT